MKQTMRVGVILVAGARPGGRHRPGAASASRKEASLVIADADLRSNRVRRLCGESAGDTGALSRPLHRPGQARVKEGAAPQGVYVMLAFDSLADAEKWYSTSPYADLIPERQKAAKSNVFIIEGLPQ